MKKTLWFISGVVAGVAGGVVGVGIYQIFGKPVMPKGVLTRGLFDEDAFDKATEELLKNATLKRVKDDVFEIIVEFPEDGSQPKGTVERLDRSVGGEYDGPPVVEYDIREIFIPEDSLDDMGKTQPIRIKDET